MSDNLEIDVLLINNTPLDDFLGLTPNQVDELAYNPFGNRSMVQLKNDIDNDTLDRIPLFRLAEEYLKIIQREKQIKLTPRGALPKKVLVELYEHRFVLEELVERGLRKVWREEDLYSIRGARLSLEMTGLVRKANGKLTLTRKAIQFVESNNRFQLFKLFFQGFTGKFNWSFNDGFPDPRVGQFAWTFSVIMLDRFGDKQTSSDFYANKYFKAFPVFISSLQEPYRSIERSLYGCYEVRVFDRFFLWFGFVTAHGEKDYFDLKSRKFTRAELVRLLFTIEQ